jgi:hypothetical protein
MYVCMCVCMYVCIVLHPWMLLCMHGVCMYVCMYVCNYVCIHNIILRVWYASKLWCICCGDEGESWQDIGEGGGGGVQGREHQKHACRSREQLLQEKKEKNLQEPTSGGEGLWNGVCVGCGGAGVGVGVCEWEAVEAAGIWRAPTFSLKVHLVPVSLIRR